ncbi:hypothetical protein NXS08_03465 [Gleimia sp. 6138-11-ORH1]|uniref:hypothetical protein n=1 Tax=Gleimia sp. 6138-11-ORH1 TaxID=2973937 RepID=UPI002168D903|nr:hypothetical protein [Gleimia sp. 6138-11-ORH1]MCS4484545.1 hypothetical protein [Gleimia sp. 6138-11-ORH1]
MNTAAARLKPRQLAPQKVASVSPLKVIDSPNTQSSKVKLLLIVLVPLIAVILGHFYINTQMAKTSFEVLNMSREYIQITEENEAIKQKIQLSSSPTVLEKNAVRLGMVPAKESLFVSIEKNAIHRNIKDF